MLFFANGEMTTGKILLLNIFLPSSPSGLKLLQDFLTCIGRFVGIFDLIHIYLGIVKSFQTLHVHMNNTAKYRYKTGTFITKKNVFKFVYNFEYSVYVYIYDVKETKRDM